MAPMVGIGQSKLAKCLEITPEITNVKKWFVRGQTHADHFASFENQCSNGIGQPNFAILVRWRFLEQAEDAGAENIPPGERQPTAGFFRARLFYQIGELKNRTDL